VKAQGRYSVSKWLVAIYRLRGRR